MNLVGKIFTVLIFVFSLVFMSFAVAVYATHKNWRAVVQNTDASKGKLGSREPQLKHDQKTANERAQRAAGQAKSRPTRRRRPSRSNVRTKLETESNETAKERDTLLKQQEDFEKQLREGGGPGQGDAPDARGPAGRGRGAARPTSATRRPIATSISSKSSSVTDELHQAANELKRLKDLNTNLAEQHAKALEVLRRIRAEGRAGSLSRRTADGRGPGDRHAGRRHRRDLHRRRRRPAARPSTVRLSFDGRA